MNWQKYIVTNPDIQYGKPVISGTRITVELIIENHISELKGSFTVITKNHTRIKTQILQGIAG